MRRFILPLGLALALAARASGVEPSANKGRRDTYCVQTVRPGYNYYVYVPTSYSDDNPAGIHLHFHGQASQGTAPNFDTWAKYFLEPYDLIGINMQYMDGDNMRDTAGKVAAAVDAIAQVCADYKIIRGRGVICSFSGGGLPHTLMAEKYGMAGAKPEAWPFNHSAAYDSNMHASVKGWAPMSWFIGLGTNEWGLARLGPDLTERAHELFQEAAAGRCPDIYLKLAIAKGHSMTGEDRAESAQIFHRSDLAFCAFLYEGDFAGTELEAVVKKANRLELGGAASDVKQLLAGPGLKPDVKKKAEAVSARIEKRVDAVLDLSKQLAEDDPLLWNYYGGIFARELKGHPRFEEFRKIAPPKETKRDPAWALSTFASDFKRFFLGGPALAPGMRDVLKKVTTSAGDKSSLGRQASDFLLLMDSPYAPQGAR